ncbi:ABC-type Mn/Zn transport systems, ATPase component [Longilinea arvoryzae]|uniref:ABC-type Mn/Zn transport systems, ATPase component n=1 Tax=Longilinea arvoryzae TaxID=360412 RepID=A0A0S7B9I9_9CHLR|nr:metal ABC transporter ATP-binding protein [Longilinea arvoryzae]GAP14159.1 ABC-type Mn/Zn transport systems, ATPase component [Longilinea arvoryzae]
MKKQSHDPIQKEPARLELENIVVAYNGHPILEDLSFEVPHGAQVAVVGPNGAGKSTLFKALVGLLPLRKGQIRIHGLPLGQHKDCVAYIPQREEVDWHFPVIVEEVVMMGRFNDYGWLGKPGEADHEAVSRSMTQMGISKLAKRSISELSGGQQQRVFLARALAQEPHILLMDEPFTGVDISTQEVTLNLLEDLHARGVTVLVSTHDLNMAAERFERILLLKRRLIAYGTREQVFTPENITAAFGKQALILDNLVVVDHCCPGDEHEHIHPEETA